MFVLANLIWDGPSFVTGFSFLLGGVIWDTASFVLGLLGAK